ncbi:MAG: hypothetical protein IVW36_04820 [Dehalococcoidia bacterium]|nr:hypothetical protein [Dehalococcoidia bacterium]
MVRSGRPPRFRAPEETADRSAAKLGLGVLLFVSLVGLFSSLVLFQLTSEGLAKRSLSRSVAALTEIDPLLDRNYADLQQRAAVAAPGDRLYLQNYPVPVPLTPSQARTISKADLRALLLDRSADEMYARGTAPLRDPATKAGSVGVFSIAGISSQGLGFLRSRNNTVLRLLTVVLAVVAALLAVALALQCRGFGRLGAAGLVTMLAALPVLVAGAGVWLYCRANDGAGSEYIRRQFAQIGAGLAWIPIRDGAAFVALGAVMVVLAKVLGAWSAGRGRCEYDAPPYVSGRRT